MNVNRHNSSSYEPFHIAFSRSAVVASIGTPNCRDVTFGGDVFVNDTGRRVMKMIFYCHKFHITGRASLDNFMIQMSRLQMGQSKRPEQVIGL